MKGNRNINISGNINNELGKWTTQMARGITNLKSIAKEICAVHIHIRYYVDSFVIIQWP